MDPWPVKPIHVRHKGKVAGESRKAVLGRVLLNHILNNHLLRQSNRNTSISSDGLDIGMVKSVA